MADTPVGPKVQVTPPSNLMARSPAYRLIYANSFRIRVSANDSAITFMVQTENMGAQVMQEEASIAMTLPALKLLWHNLDVVLKELEKTLGPVKVPESSKVRPEQFSELVKSLAAIKFVE